MRGILRCDNIINQWALEPFIWYCAEAFATAGTVMLQSDTKPNPVSDWTPIIHCDWKLANIFLDNNDLPPYSRYPIPVLEDLGAAAYNRADGDHYGGTENNRALLDALYRRHGGTKLIRTPPSQTCGNWAAV